MINTGRAVELANMQLKNYCKFHLQTGKFNGFFLVYKNH